MIEAESFIGDDAATAPEFMQQLEKSLHEAPRFLQQQLLPLDAQEMDALSPFGEKGKSPRSSPKNTPTAPGPQFRVEVWRETKRGQRKIRVIKL